MAASGVRTVFRRKSNGEKAVCTGHPDDRRAGSVGSAHAEEPFKKAGRDDLVTSYLKEVDILKEYMPKELSEEELDEIIDNAIKETGATTVKDLGSIMRIITPIIKNKCNMKEVTNKIKTKLS